jgi:hypothetical protein
MSGLQVPLNDAVSAGKKKKKNHKPSSGSPLL